MSYEKISVIFAALALLAASCTKTEVVSSDVQSSQRGIGFSAYTAKPTKTAQKDVTNDNFDSFEVTAIGNGAIYFDNVTFLKGASVWESDPLYFWPSYALDFYAYNTPADGNGTFTRSITTTAPQTLTYSPAAELAKQEDLVVAYATSKKESDATSTNNSLALTFNHYLTQVVVNAKCSNAGYTVVVDGVKLANLAGEGTYTFSSSTMEATAAKVNSDASSDYSSTFTAKPLTSSPKEVMAETSGKWYLIPQTVTPWKRVPTESTESATNEMKNASNGTYLALKVKITSAGGSKIYPFSGDESAWMAVPVPAGLKFEQGKKYNVTVDFFSSTGNGAGYVDPEKPGELDGITSTDDSGKKIIGGAIKFDATVTEWGNAVDITISL
ncbi:MAG: fimbrillin family protein [Candidatus Cryptobacteroides sp.]